jgi:hypothetical protein
LNLGHADDNGSGCVMYQKLASLGLVVLVAGCGFHRAGSDDGGSGGSTDMSSPDPSCPLPQLIITIADVSGSNAFGGQLARFSLASATPMSCKTLTAQMSLGAGVSVSTYFAPSLIATADQNSVYLIDALHDQPMATVAAPTSSVQGTGALDAFPMKDTSGKDFGAVAFGAFGNPDTDTQVVGYDGKGMIVAKSPFCLSGTSCSGTNLMLGDQIVGVAANPTNPSHFFVVDEGRGIAAEDVDPFTRAKMSLLAINTTASMQKAYAISHNGQLRIAWVTVTSFGATPPTWVSYYTDMGGSSFKSVSGPLSCQSGCSNVLRAVPDPTSPTAFFLLCDGASSNGRVVMRLQDDGTCTPIFDGSTLSSAYQLRHLAIAQ